MNDTASAHPRWPRFALWPILLLAASCGADPVEESAPPPQPMEGPEALTRPVTTSSRSLAEAMEAQQQATEMLEGAMREVNGPPIKTVGELVERRTCSTELTYPLNIQLAAQMNCIRPGFFEPVSDVGNLDLGPAANPFLQAPAAQALREAADERPEVTLSLNSSWRSVAQQHILKRWKGSCGIRVVADPGTSHHESGLAIDVPTETTRDFRDHLKREGWVWYCDATNGGRTRGCRDRPHYTYKRSGEDLRSLNVLAFQKLWNHAHPDDPIQESGHYNRATARRLDKAPLEGFAAGPTCDSRQFIAEVTQSPEERALTMAIKAHQHIEASLVRAHELAAAQRPVPVPETAVKASWSPATLLTQLFDM